MVRSLTRRGRCAVKAPRPPPGQRTKPEFKKAISISGGAWAAVAAPAQGQGSETSPLENRAASADPSGASSIDVNPGRRGPRRLFPVRLRSHQPLTRRERALSPPCHQHRGAHHLPRRWVTRALGSMAGSLLTHPRFTYSLPRCQSAMLHCPFPCPSPPHPRLFQLIPSLYFR